MKLAFILGSMSVGNRPLDFWFNNIFTSTRGATGTDIAFCMISKELQKLGHEVHMFTIHAQPEHKPDMWEGCKLYNFIDRHIIIDNTFDAVISINEPDVFRGINSNALRICYQFLNDYTYCQSGFDDYVDYWVNVCESHKNYLLTQARTPNINKCSVIPLGVDPDWYTDQRIPGRVVWTSSADRGLHNLLEIWPKIKASVPYASLKIFYHFEYGQLLGIEPYDMQHHFHSVEMANRLRYIVESVKRLKHLDVMHCKSVSRDQMVTEMNEASVFAFPCDTVATTEGFSVSTLEAHASFTVPIITDQDCLGSIYNNSGAIVFKSPVRERLPEFTDAIIKGLTDKPFADDVIEKCRKFAVNHTWTKTAKMMEQLIISKVKKFPDIFTKKMKIGLITTHSFPVPYKIHTGDIVIANLAQALDEMGHEVTFYAPDGSYCPPHGSQLTMPCSYGEYPPRSEDCEQECFNLHRESLMSQDIVHDFSISKIITKNLYSLGKKSVISTIMGGPWMYPYPPHNLVAWSQSHRDRVIRGVTDYEGTLTPDLAGNNGYPVKDVFVVNGGIDTNWYTPTYDKRNFLLWMNKWNPTRGYKMAIEIAKKTGLELVMAGEHPDNEMFEYQKQCALEAIELSKGYPNIKFEWLPLDPNHHTAKRELFRQAKALLYTVQFCEPFGLSQAEALSCGTPVIGINYGSVSEVIQDGITGYVRENNLDDLSDAVSMINNIDPRVCRDQAVRRFDIKVMAQNYLTQYKNIINGELMMETKKQKFKDKEFTVIKGSVHPEYSYFTFEKEEIEFRDAYWNIQKDDVVFDVGASYGTYTLSAASMGATVFSFEPEKTVHCDLVQNILINKFEDKCLALNLGLWRDDTVIDMKEYAPHWPQHTITEKYQATSLDAICEKYNVSRLDWIKIDVEGAEENVVIGGLKSIIKYKPNLIIECHTFLDPELVNKIKTLLSLVVNYEFEEVPRPPCIMLCCKYVQQE